jgi:hypothetical protein
MLAWALALVCPPSLACALALALLAALMGFA